MGGGSKKRTLQTAESLHFDSRVKPALDAYRKKTLRPLLIGTGLGKTNIVDALADMVAAVGCFAGMIKEGADSEHLKNYHLTIDSFAKYLQKREVRGAINTALNDAILGRKPKSKPRVPGKAMTLESFITALEGYSEFSKEWLLENIFILDANTLAQQINALGRHKDEVLRLKQDVDAFVNDNALVIAYMPLIFNLQEQKLEHGEKNIIPVGIVPNMVAYAKLLLYFLDDVEAYLNKFTEDKALNLFVSGLSASETGIFQLFLNDKMSNKFLYDAINDLNDAIRAVNDSYQNDSFISEIPEALDVPEPVEACEDINERRKKQVLVYLKILIKGNKDIAVSILRGLIEKYECGIYDACEQASSNSDSNSLEAIANTDLREMAELIVSLEAVPGGLSAVSSNYLNGDVSAIVFEEFINDKVAAKIVMEAHHERLAANLKRIITTLQQSVEEPTWYEKTFSWLAFGENLSVRERETLALLNDVAKEYGTAEGPTRDQFFMCVYSRLQLHKPVETSLLSQRIMKHLPVNNYEILSKYYALSPVFSGYCLREDDIFSEGFIRKVSAKPQEDDGEDQLATCFDTEYDEYLAFAKMIMLREEDATLKIEGHEISMKAVAQGLIDQILPVSYFRKVVTVLNASEALNVQQVRRDFIGQRATFFARDCAEGIIKGFEKYKARMDEGTWGLFFKQGEWHGQAGMERAKKLLDIANAYKLSEINEDQFLGALREHFVGKKYNSYTHEARVNHHSFDTYLLKALFAENKENSDTYEILVEVSKGEHRIQLGQNANSNYLGEFAAKCYKQDVMYLLKDLTEPANVSSARRPAA